MKNKILRFFSLITAIILTVTAFPISASATSFNRIVNAATEIIVINEGNYTTVVRNDNGALSLGKICWHGTNALNLLKDIIAENPSQALNILGDALYNEIITRSSWDTRIATASEAAVLSILLSTTESHKIQDKRGWEYISSYVEHGQSLGITEPEALVFFADYENQMGRNGATSFYYQVKSSYGTVNLGTLYSASSRNARRVRTYNFCATIDWGNISDTPVTEKDNDAPEIANVSVSNINSQGYTVSFSATDNKNVSSIYIAVFFKDDGPEKAVWYKQESLTDVEMTVNISEFGNRTGYYQTYIYVFDEAGNYAYVELNPIKISAATPSEPQLSLTISATSASAVGDKIRWRASATGGSGNYLYSFSLYRDSKEIARRGKSDYKDYEYEIDKTGTYKVMATVYDKTTEKSVSVISAEINIFTPIVIESFKSNMPAALIGQSVSWQVTASGGEGDLEYSYTLYKDDTIIQSTDFKASAKYTFKPSESGVYSVSVNIKDSRSQVVSHRSENITVIQPLSAENVIFSTDYTVAGKEVSCSVDVSGGSGSYTCKFSIYCDGTPVITGDSDTNEFSFIVTEPGKYTAVVTVTDADSTVTKAGGGKLSVDAKAKKGDANCDGSVNASDARYALRCAAALETVEDAFRYAVDVNEDGKINASDARRILRVVAQLETF